MRVWQDDGGGGGGGGGTPLKSTTGQYVVGTRITACYVCVCVCICVRAYTIVPCWKKREEEEYLIYILWRQTWSEQCYTMCVCACV